jgi:hypothetical protein
VRFEVKQALEGTVLEGGMAVIGGARSRVLLGFCLVFAGTGWP